MQTIQDVRAGSAVDPAAVGDLVDAMLGFHRALRSHGFAHGSARGEATADLSRTDVVVLGLLASQGPMRPGRVAARLGCSASVVSRRLAALDAVGLVVRDTDPLDGRAELVSASRAGRERLEQVRRLLVEHLADRLHDWAAADVRRATALVSDLVDRLVAPANPAHPATH